MTVQSLDTLIVTARIPNLHQNRQNRGLFNWRDGSDEGEKIKRWGNKGDRAVCERDRGRGRERGRGGDRGRKGEEMRDTDLDMIVGGATKQEVIVDGETPDWSIMADTCPLTLDDNLRVHD